MTALHAAVYRRSGGRILGGFRRTRFLLLETTGRRSGKRRVTPLNHVTDGDAFVVVASNGGAARHPDWYLNLLAEPRATVQVGGRRVGVVAETVEGDERARLWRAAQASWRYYDDYQRRTDREIPVVRLRPAPA
ncbi:MAG TPA: nitroreductase family deazaflavin-dependent oxidoreductase [Acidimicrobiales bacterium]